MMIHLTRVLLLTFLFISLQAFQQMGDKNCNFTVKVVKSERNNVELVVTGAEEPVRYFLINEDNRLISEESSFKGLKSGNYEYLIIDKRGCKVTGKLNL